MTGGEPPTAHNVQTDLRLFRLTLGAICFAHSLGPFFSRSFRVLGLWFWLCFDYLASRDNLEGTIDGRTTVEVSAIKPVDSDCGRVCSLKDCLEVRCCSTAMTIVKHTNKCLANKFSSLVVVQLDAWLAIDYTDRYWTTIAENTDDLHLVCVKR